MYTDDEKNFIRNAVFKAVAIDEAVKLDCKSDSEFEFYSMYGSIVRDLWERTWRSFDSYDKFLDYCEDCKKIAAYYFLSSNAFEDR